MAESGRGASRRVLVIDDERALRELLEYGLSQAGFAVRSATDGSAALALLQPWPPDVIVLDVMLPERRRLQPASRDPRASRRRRSSC